MTCSLLSEQLNVLLGSVAGLLNLLCTLYSAGLELLCFGLDLLDQAVKDRENAGLDVLLSLEVRVCQTLPLVS